MKITLLAALLCVLFVGSSFAQAGKQWNEWSKKDAEKMISDSAWAQTIKKGEAPPDISNRSGGARSQQNASSNVGPAPLDPEVYLRIRLISARPIREGFASRLLRSRTDQSAELTARLQGLIDEAGGNFVVVAVNVEGQNPQTVGATLNGLARLKAVDLADKVYLERKDGKRLPLIDYKAPVADDMGGKFIFARELDGSPFLTSESDSFKFILNLTGNLKFNARFDVSRMEYNGKLEY